MTVSKKLRKGAEVLQEAWLLSRVPSNEGIFQYLRMVAENAATRVRERGFRRYLEDYPEVGQIIIQKNWYYNDSFGEMRLNYTNSLFASGCLRIKSGQKVDSVIVFLPGNQAGADDVLGDANHRQNMLGVARELSIGIACWDWPLQGRRRDGCLYRGLRSVYSGEREYSRILPTLGTSLWREMVAELKFALEQIRYQVGLDRAIHVVGWSMGGYFAYLASLLGTHITTITAAGSCASIKDLLAEGKTRLHGYFFYPLNGLAYFDLEDVIADLLYSGHPLLIIHGENDAGCLERTRQNLTKKAENLGHDLRIDVLPGHGHVFSPTIKRRIVGFLSAHDSKSI